MPVGDFVNLRALDRGSIDQAHNRDEVTAVAVLVGADQYGMARREEKIARGTVLSQGVRRDADRYRFLRARMVAAIDRAMAYPADGLSGSTCGDEKIADR